MKIYDPIHKNVIIMEGTIRNCIYNILYNKFKIEGCNNTITIGGGVKLTKGLFFVIGSYNFFQIGSKCSFSNFVMRADGDRNKIIVGNGVTFGGGALNAIDRTEIKIGDDCMLSYGIDIMSSDGHPIFVKGKSSKYNRSKSISIGKHVWIGMKTQILKGVVIPNNCVVGAGSLVNKPFSEDNCIIGGHPAKVIKQNVYWKR